VFQEVLLTQAYLRGYVQRATDQQVVRALDEAARQAVRERYEGRVGGRRKEPVA
jgi:hypothetical protein